jgi:hypothetical protein
MNTKLSLILCIAALALLRSTAPAADNRFDGVWVGTERVMVQAGNGFHTSEFEKKKPAKIVIAQGGTLLGVLEGYGPGRYSDVKRVGNTIVFHAGPRTGQLSLSADGQTMMEKGHVLEKVEGFGHQAGALPGGSGGGGSGLSIITEVTGVFDRQK